MKRMTLAGCMGAVMAVAVIAGFAETAAASARGYCESYARDVAHRKTNGGADVVGTAGVADQRYSKAYERAFANCMDNYESDPVVSTEEPAAAETPEVAEKPEVVDQPESVEKPEIAESAAAAPPPRKVKSANRAEACAKKYVSYDAERDKYKSYSGVWKPCRL